MSEMTNCKNCGAPIEIDKACMSIKDYFKTVCNFTDDEIERLVELINMTTRVISED